MGKQTLPLSVGLLHWPKRHQPPKKPHSVEAKRSESNEKAFTHTQPSKTKQVVLSSTYTAPGHIAE